VALDGVPMVRTQVVEVWDRSVGQGWKRALHSALALSPRKGEVNTGCGVASVDGESEGEDSLRRRATIETKRIARQND
jgi:hypothetical protein